jgi:endonuclease V-like protein UPF0215 family
MTATIKFKGFEFDVEFFYEPAEDSVYNYGDGTGYPGWAEEYQFSKIELNGIDATELLEAYFEDFEEEAIQQIKNNY